MADQRRSQRAGHGGRHRRGVGGLGLVVLLALTLGACEAGSPVTPDYLPVPGEGNPGIGGNGGGGAQRLLGTWEATTITELPADDFITAETTWVFRADTGCLQTIQTLQFSEGITYTSVRACTYTLAQGVLHVLYEGAITPTDYLIEFPINDNDLLIIEGITYERVI